MKLSALVALSRPYRRWMLRLYHYSPRKHNHLQGARRKRSKSLSLHQEWHLQHTGWSNYAGSTYTR